MTGGLNQSASMPTFQYELQATIFKIISSIFSENGYEKFVSNMIFHRGASIKLFYFVVLFFRLAERNVIDLDMTQRIVNSAPSNLQEG